jgi:hypothetical protein
MSADTEFERRLGADLVAALDRVDGPHPTWAGSPAAVIVAADGTRSARPAPWRLLAVAAVLVVGSVAAVVLSSRGPDEADPAVAGCPTLADYAAASALPTPAWNRAPDVSFPPVAPTATMTTGLLRPGDWAVIADDDGPGLQIRVRDVRECGRLPDVRSQFPNGSLILATVDVRTLRKIPGFSWLGVTNLMGIGIGEYSPGYTVVPGSVFSVPGVITRTNLDLPDPFAQSSLLVLDVPDTNVLITADHPSRDAMTLPGIDLSVVDLPRARWVLRDGPATGYPDTSFVPPTPGPTDTTGAVAVDEQITVQTSEGALAFKVTDVGSVLGYPGLEAAPDHVFVEARVVITSFAGGQAPGLNAWRALDADGRELTFLEDPGPTTPADGVLGPLMSREGRPDAWLVMEAPADGPVTLEYRHGGTGDPIVIRIRD